MQNRHSQHFAQDQYAPMRLEQSKFYLCCDRYKNENVLCRRIDELKKIRIFPAKWIQGIDLFQLLNYGLAYVRRIPHTIFIPSNGSMIGLDILPDIDDGRSACYLAYVLHTQQI